MDDERKKRVLADIDRVLAYQPSYGGTGAVTEIATSYMACILRWAPPGSTYRRMAEAIDPFPPASGAAKLEQHVRALMATFRRDVEAGHVDLETESNERAAAMNEEQVLNAKARKVLAYLRLWAVKAGGGPFSVTPSDPDTLKSTGLDGEEFMRAGGWLVRKSLAEWFTAVGLTITSYGLQVAGDDRILDYELPVGAKVDRTAENQTMAEVPDKKKVFIIHGRNTAARVAVEHFLKALKLEPLDFDELAGDMPSEFVGNIVLEGLKRAHGIVVLFTPDEYATLYPLLREQDETDGKRWQSRPNVIFEAGIAFGIARDRSILATMGSNVSLFSDVKGIHIARLDNSEDSRKTFRQKLIGARCDVDQRADSYTDPARSGDFEGPVAGYSSAKPIDPFAPPPVVAPPAPAPKVVGEDEALGLAKTWLHRRRPESASFTYDEISKALSVPVPPEMLRRVLPRAAQGTSWQVAAYEHTVALTFHLPGPMVAGGPSILSGGDY